MPVYIVYFTVAATSDGPPMSYADMYGRDGKVLAALTDRGRNGAGVFGEVSEPLPPHREAMGRGTMRSMVEG